MEHLISFSGGKDSTALVLWALEHLENPQFMFCDTGWEHQLTYDYIDYINETLMDRKLIVLKSKKYPNGMRELVKKRKRVPSVKARFCTSELKIYPVKDFIDSLDDESTQYLGIRADESLSRSKMPIEEFDDYFDCVIKRPLLYWSSKDVFDYLDKHNIKPNPLYKMGASRVGCFPCVMSGVGEYKRMDDLLPEVWDRCKDLSKETVDKQSFFRPGTIPDRWCSREAKGVKFPTVEDVKAYVQQDKDQLTLFEPVKCMSIYNLCE